MIFLSNLWRFIPIVQCYLASLLFLSAVTGDILVHYLKKHVYRALFDNATHAVIGGLSWFIVCLGFRGRNSVKTLLEISTCTAVSSMIDLDHFLVAKSLSLKDATNLKSRPLLHCTTIPLVVTPILLFITYGYELQTLHRYTMVVFTAFITHHTRDATRRGFWLYPFGSTQPIPYFSYVLSTVFIPYLICACFHLFKWKQAIPTNFENI